MNELFTYKPDLIIYHGGCFDGLAGAWCFYNILGSNDKKFYPGKHGEKISDDLVTDKNILFIDFSYRKTDTEHLLTIAKSLTVLDHHKTAEDLLLITDSKLTVYLDMTRSGAQLAWDYVSSYLNKETNMLQDIKTIKSSNGIIPYTKRPYFIDDIGDRDLWTWNVPNSKESCAAMYHMQLNKSLNTFNAIQYIPRELLLSTGFILVQQNRQQIDMICKKAVDCKYIGEEKKEFKVRVCMTDIHVSEVGNQLVTNNPCDFAAICRYNLSSDEWWISLRASDNNDIDLSEVCRVHFKTGGGHKKASGIALKGADVLKQTFIPLSKEESFTVK